MRRSLKWGGNIVAVWLAVGAVAFAQADQPPAETVTIPLDQIWAYNMPGTRDVRKLDEPPPKASLVEPIQQSLGPKRRTATSAQGFAVRGDAHEALRQAYQVLVAGHNASQQFMTGEEIWIVFFSFGCDRFVHLHEVERIGNEIVVRYRFVPHDSQHMTEHFALIPLGKLPAGQFFVRIVHSPIEKNYSDMGYTPVPDSTAVQKVSRPFEVVVLERPSK